MKKILSLLSLAALTVGLLGSCSKINERIYSLEKRIDGIESTSIASVQQQIDGIKASITKLEAADVTVNGKIDELKATAEAQQKLIDALKEADKALGQKDTELESRIAALEGQVATINGQIKTLEEAGKAINDRIDELKTYVDTEIGKTKDWAKETFATLEQYQKTAEDLAALSVTVTGISTTLAEVQTSIAGLDTKINGIDADLQGKITAAKTELEGKITSLKTELEGKIATAISTSETSIKSWINELLEGYYTIAQVDAKIGALNTAIETAKSTSKTRIDSVATELTALKKVVDTEKATIRAEYKNSIDVAINKLNGEIRGALKDSVVAVNGRIATLDTRVTTLELKMQAVEGRVDKLEAALGKYTELQSTITEIIKKLLADVGDKPKDQQDTTIWKCITALQAQCGTFGIAIETLQGLVGSKDVATQISDAIASLISTQKLEGLADAVSKLKNIVDVNVNDVKTLTLQIAEINEKLSMTNAGLDNLSKEIAATKADLQEQIEILKQRTDQNTEVFNSKIADLNEKVAALEALVQVMEYKNLELSAAVQDVLDKVNALELGDISELRNDLDEIDARLSNIEAMIQSVSIIPAYSDGSVKADKDGILTLKCIVSPAEALIGMASLEDCLLIYADSVEVKTKAAPACMKIEVEDASILDEELGVITLTADISESLPKGEGKALTVALHIENGISNFTTEFVPVYVAAAPDPEYVEMTMTVGGVEKTYKWTKCNLGADKETDYGKYYSWGDVTGQSAATPQTGAFATAFSWLNCPFNNGRAGSCDVTYFNTVKETVCPDNILAKEYDVANKVLGGKWRMPTKEEFEALCSLPNAWKTNYNNSGVNGYLFTDKNDNSIFFPAAGNGQGNDRRTAGQTAYYWSSSLYTDVSKAYRLDFLEDTFAPRMSDGVRYTGQSVRAISE